MLPLVSRHNGGVLMRRVRALRSTPAMQACMYDVSAEDLPPNKYPATDFSSERRISCLNAFRYCSL